MRLGEALSLRARQAQKLNDLRGRVKQNAVAQEGTEPAESVVTLISEYLEVSEEHRHLLVRIQITNVSTDVDGASLLALLQSREALIRERNLASLAAAAGTLSDSNYRYMRSELKYIPQLNVASFREREDDLNEQIRILDAQIQSVNWATDLI